MKSIAILGSTGSIGCNALRVAEALPDELRIVGLAARSNYQLLLEQAVKYHVSVVALQDEQAAEAARRVAPPNIKVLSGVGGLEELAALPEADVVVSALVGMAGLRPTLAALEAGHDVALATKEVLVAAGEPVMRLCAEKGTRLLPVDSEHSALFQCLQSAGWEPACVRRANAPVERFAESRIAKVVLTASGGPFFANPEVDFSTVTPEQALDHPRWKMGAKVTIDSATMMNKGLEMIEARWLFNLPAEQIDIVIHPESAVHSLVQFCDSSLLAQLSPPDMRFAIQYALTWPDRKPAPMEPLDLTVMGALHFHAPDAVRFPCLRLAREAIRAGGTLPAVMNAANEVAVELFLQKQLDFPGIWRVIEETMATHTLMPHPTLNDIFETDEETRRLVRRACHI